MEKYKGRKVPFVCQEAVVIKILKSTRCQQSLFLFSKLFNFTILSALAHYHELHTVIHFSIGDHACRNIYIRSVAQALNLPSKDTVEKIPVNEISSFTDCNHFKTGRR